MKKSMLRVLSFLLILTFVLPLVSCSVPVVETTGETETVLTDIPVTTEPEPEPEPEPKFCNPYTGLECEERLVGRRPIAAMINNLKIALPQSGINKCDILYEVEAEGGILRMCGIILDYENAGILGSMRSARPYYVELALANDAVFVHAGGSTKGYDWISNLKVDDVDGVKRGPFNVDGVNIFWRDRDRLNKGVPLEHTMFTSGENVTKAIAFKGYRTTLNNPEFRAFNFAKSASPLATGQMATEIVIPHSTYSVSRFNYNATDKKYYHSEYDAPHVDGQDGQQVAVDNVFILYANSFIYPNQSGTTYRDIQIVGEGNGYYFYGGEYKSIIWRRADSTASFTYYNTDGTELVVNPGRSYISIANKDIYGSTAIS